MSTAPARARVNAVAGRALAPLPAEPHVTICVPAHDAERVVEEALRSILAQTYPHLDVIVIDDCSSDATPAVLARLRDPRLRVIRNESNLGGYQTMNEAIAMARGDLVAVFHADDVYEPGMVAEEVACLQRHPEAGAVFTQNHMIDETGRLLGTNRVPPPLSGREVLSYEEVFPFLLRNKNILFCCPTFMARRDVLDEVGPFDAERYDVAADLDMWIRILQRHAVAMVDKPLMRYRHASTQWSARYSRLRTSQELFFDIMDAHIAADGWRGRLRADDCAEYAFHRVDDMTVRAANCVMLGRPDEARPLLAAQYPWRSLVARPTRRKLRVAAMRAALKTSVSLGMTSVMARVLAITEGTS